MHLAKPPIRIWGFLCLPAEVRLQILASTHLGPPSTGPGSYDARFSILQVRDGRIVPRHQLPLRPWDDPPSWTKCASPQAHGTSPQCRCRIIPTQLFTVSRQISAEALEVFYTNLHLDLDPCSSFLRSLSPQNIHRLRRVTFTMTPAQVEGWCNGAVASGYNAATLESQVAIPYWGGGAVKPPGEGGKDFYRRAWREVIAVLAAYANLPRLALKVEIGECTWVYFEDAILWEESMSPEEIRPIFRFIYDFYIDVVTALCELRGLGALELRLSAFEHLKPWLEREVLGRSSEPKVQGANERKKRSLWYHAVPQWHDGDRRLEGSNYRPPGQSDES